MKLALYEKDQKVFTTDLETLKIFVESCENGNELDLIKYNDKFYFFTNQTEVDGEEEYQYRQTKVYELV